MTRIQAETIETVRLVLEPLRIEHAEPMALVLDDPRLHDFIGGAPASAPQLRSQYSRMLAGPSDPAESWCNWVIRFRENHQLTGTVQATISPDPDPDPDADPDPDPDADGRRAEIAYVIGAAWQRRGIATEATTALVDWLTGQSIHAVIAHIHPDHRASAAVATAAGLTPTAELHDGEIRWHRKIN
ncbi:GNAT family N-acetyltransferase [Actinospica sp.]|uniref:GNAT family N-acetyltransferase n=1 Tax=Actinospica sp. TaxID=1872142 RepID=UPI002C38A5C5|nr:GNAT family N-acetyltransferase [Actinospica sp.]HWG27567.1 GNAT family N-acetyltransferase [Actinospica sp.]